MISGKTIFIAHGWSVASVNAQSVHLSIGLAKHNKVYFLNAKKSQQATENIVDNVTIYQWPGKRPVGWKDFLFALKKVRQHKPDIIVTNFAANDIMLFVSWLLGVKKRVCYYHTMVQQHVADIGHIDTKQHFNIWRKGFVFRMATHMLCPSSAAKKDLVKYYKVNADKAFVFPNTLPDTTCRNNGDRTAIGFLGRLDRSKGVDILIDAFRMISDSFNGIKLFIVGAGAKEKELKARVEDMQLNERIIFKGTIVYEKVPLFLSSLDFVIIPSRMDNLPTVILEAFSVATPVIGSNAGGIPDMIQEGYNGLLFENGNAKDLAEKMMFLLSNREQRDTISAGARKTFEEKYCMNTLLAKFEALLNQDID